MATTVGEALRGATRRLAAVGAPASDAEELLSRLIGVGRGDLRTRVGAPLEAELVNELEEQLARRLAGEPVQYITGRAAFRSLDLAVDRRVLVPRPETEWLVEAVLEYLVARAPSARPPRVLDLGTGSGCIALSIAHEYARADVVATDASEDALQVARANAEALGLHVTFLRGEWLEALASDERFDVIVANPPYISPREADALPRDVHDFEPHAALFAGDDGLADLREIVDQAPRHLRAGGLLALELDETRAAEVAAWFDGARDWRGAELRPDLAGRPRMLLATREHGPAIAPAQWGEEG
ncbi:MAG TPA: peptide chain release factor N(5)-glutamine methyltransferase [Verrucomicrobiae bacterium]|nr:peptide chain release factor N(5)-glutamine methyltransferase [Verrucomicrobiae bacterium]